VATEPPMDLLVSKLIRPYRLAWSGSNKAVSLSFNWRRSDSLRDRFQVYHVNGWGFASQPDALRFHNSDCLHVYICGISFSLLFSNLYKLFH